VRGANGQGRTLDEARESVREAIELLLEIAREESEKELADQQVVREVITVAS
jgi:predicted RNase H-like HicB family nuclease